MHLLLDMDCFPRLTEMITSVTLDPALWEAGHLLIHLMTFLARSLAKD